MAASGVDGHKLNGAITVHSANTVQWLKVETAFAFGPMGRARRRKEFPCTPGPGVRLHVPARKKNATFPNPGTHTSRNMHLRVRGKAKLTREKQNCTALTASLKKDVMPTTSPNF